MAETLYRHPRRALFVWFAVLLLATALVAAGNTALFRHIQVMREESAWTYIKLAQERQDENDWVSAIELLKEAARREPQSPLPHEHAGMIYYDQGTQWEKALQCFLEALEHGSDSVDIRGKTMWSFIHLGRFGDAAEFGIQCIKNEGQTSPNFPRYVAEALRRSGKHAESIPYLKDALKSFPNDMYLLERLAYAHEQAGEDDKAKAIRERMEYLSEN